MIVVVYKISTSTIIYILVKKLLSIFNGKVLKIFTIEENIYFQKLFKIELLNWKIIEFNENKLNKLIEINYIKTNAVIDELFEDINLNKYIKDNNLDRKAIIYIKKAIFSDDLPGLNLNIKKLLIILEVLKLKFKGHDIIFAIKNFKFIDFFRNKYFSEKIYIKGLINISFIKYNIKNFFLVYFSNILSKLPHKFFFKEKPIFEEKFNKIVIDTPFENIDENEIFLDSNFIFTSFLHSISNRSKEVFEKKNLNYKSINFNSNKKNFFNKNYKLFYIKIFFHFDKMKFSFSDNYINRILILYFIEKKIWFDFFVSNKSRVYYSKYKWSRHVESASSAIEMLNGISLLSYHSFYEYVSYSSIVSTDILLSFNDNFDKIERNAGSIYKINLPVGYPKTIPKEIDQKIQDFKSYFSNKNIKKTILFLDQGNTANEKFDLGISESSKGFSVMFDLVIKYPEVGLIIKPKKPKTILNKINKIKNFKEALLTNRLYIEEKYTEGNSKNLRVPPYIPASVCDLVIHDHLVAATAGIDAHLACDRVIYFDHYQFEKKSIFNTFKNKENIIYNDWTLLKQKVEDFIKGNNTEIGLWDKDDFLKLVKNDNSYVHIRKILNEINTDLFNGKDKDKILSELKKK